MKSLASFRISQKIMLLVLGLAVGFAAIGVAYYVQMTTEKSIAEQRNQLSENSTILGNIRVDIIELNRVLMEFIALRDPALLGASQNLKKSLLNKIELLNSRAGDIGISEDLQSIDGLVRVYDTQYQDAVSLLQRMGDGHSEGLLWQLKQIRNSLFLDVSPRTNIRLVKDLVILAEREASFVVEPSPETFEDLSEQAVVVQDLSKEPMQEMSANFNVSISAYTDILNQLRLPVQSLRNIEIRLKSLGDNLTEAIALAANHLTEYAQKTTYENQAKSQYMLILFVGLSVGVILAMALGVFLIYRSIVYPMAHIQSVIKRINSGNFQARVELDQEDELGDLGRAFNGLLDDRIQTLEEQSLENEQLNNSIISLIKALGAIAQKNLAIRVPVSKDITGSISDAVNLLTTEMAKTLSQVKDISVKVNSISDLLQQQSTNVLRVAEDERKQVMATSKALDLAARAMNEIAARAETADNIATKTIADTQEARSAVMKSVSGILTIRETISETEKRIKRLGDRSQEISGIVNLINTIAERTHILALNASMHAASAGEAGKGFAIVADEVQRLAENARDATAEISSMVNNIRIETSDTVNIMNKLITDVAQGTRLAEKAGARMDITEEATRQLVETVQAIAHSSIHQAQIANKINDRANIIRNFTEKTGSELVQQKRHTDNLKHYAEVLLERVNIFELPLQDDVLEPPVLKVVESELVFG